MKEFCIIVPPDWQVMVHDADERTRLLIYHSLIHLNEPFTEPEYQDRLHRTAAAICRI